MRSSAEITFAGETLVLDAQGALYWPREELLVVSDLHLEKASFLAVFGSMIPRYDTRHTLQKLAGVIDVYKPAHVICLGDSFHDRHAYHRLEKEDIALLNQLVTATKNWHWVLGNHDPQLSSELSGYQHAELGKGPISFRHEPEGEGPQIVGHFHPKMQVRLRGGSAKGPVFLHDESMIIMPAFGSFTGGLYVTHEAIATLVRNPAYFLLYRGKIWPVRL